MRGLWRYQFRRSTLWLVAYLAVLLGIGFAKLGWFVPPTISLVVGLCLMLRLRKRTFLTIALLIMVCGSLGLARGAVYLRKQAEYAPLYMRKTVLLVRASGDGVYGKHSAMTFDAGSIQRRDGKKLTGKIQVSGFGMNAVYQGDEIAVSGKLYPGYGVYQGRMSFAQLQLVKHHSSWVADIRRRFAAGMQSALPEPLAPFAMGLLIGQRATLPAENKQDLLMVGLTHIIAVSGYNLTIMLHSSRRLFGKRSKRIGTFLTLGLIALFLLLAGASASIVRAAVVSVLSIAAGYYGRNFRALNLLALAAMLTAWANPFYIWSDISWYLSFLAFFGVMVLAPLLIIRLPFKLQKSLVIGVAVESISAEAMTLPYVLHMFGQMSLIGLPANVLVVTLVPLAMLLGLIAGLVGTWLGPLSGWFAWPAKTLLTYMLDIAHLLAHIPHIFIENIGVSLVQMLGLYGVVLITIAMLDNKTKHAKPATITDTKLHKLPGDPRERAQQMVHH